MLAGIPEHIRSLNLTLNTLNRYKPAVLAKIFSSISHSIKQLDLSENNLGGNNYPALLEALAVLTAGTTVILKNNYLFKTNHTHAEKDALLLQLRQANPDIYLDISCNNGDSDIQRAMAPLVCFAKKPVNEQGGSVPTDTLVHTLSFLSTKNTSATHLNKKFLDAAEMVEKKQSVNDYTPIGAAIADNDIYGP
ncbi:MAG: hypothetical protein P1U36_10335 [Legionellaceae bacterium]|nr:hypothetical protein [Legionellaceae bacterium]